ncbi:MAG TPA: S8 family serine peptidase [Bryobacteraceae bacterium]|nr:S8 family serine peptidase [Bryobacteraceae bacterium]
MPFPAAEGRGLKIAVIDSGVNARHPHIIAATHGVVLETDSGGGSAEDRLGHGTAVMAAIQEKAPAAEYFAVKLFWDSLRTTVPRLIAAVDWAIAHGMDIVNLSLGTPNLEHGRLFEALLERAAARGAILVAPTHSDERPMLPGILPGVVSAGVDWNLPRHAYRTGGEGQPRFFASGYPRPLAGRPPGGNLYGISFAAANLTGIVARALEGTQDRRFDTVHGLLAQEAHRIAAG